MPSGKTATPEIVDNKDGTVTVRYAPTEVGLHEMHIKYMGSHIPGESASTPLPPGPEGLQESVVQSDAVRFLVADLGMQCGPPCRTKQPVTPADLANFQQGRCSRVARVTVQAFRSGIVLSSSLCLAWPRGEVGRKKWETCQGTFQPGLQSPKQHQGLGQEERL